MIKTLYDLLTDLILERRRAKDSIFKNHITPCYEAAKTVFSDYQSYYQEFRKLILSNSDIQACLDFVEKRRADKLADRYEIRGVIESYFDNRYRDNSNDTEEKLPEFESAVLRLVSGSEEVDHEFKHFIRRLENHLYRQKMYEKNTPIPKNIKDKEMEEFLKQEMEVFTKQVVNTIDRQIVFLENCFNQITVCYGKERKKISK